MGDQDPSQNPGKPEIQISHRDSSVEIFNVEQILTDSEREPQRIFDRSDFGGNIERAFVETAIAQNNHGEKGLHLELIILLDQMHDQSKWITNVGNKLSTKNAFSSQWYSAEAVMFGNTLNVQTQKGLRMLAWLDNPRKRIVVTNNQKLITTDHSIEKKEITIAPPPLDGINLQDQLEDFGKLMVMLLDLASTAPNEYTPLTLARTYRLGEKISPSPMQTSRQLGSIALSSRAPNQIEQSNSTHDLPEIIDQTLASEELSLDDIGGSTSLKQYLKDIALSFKNAEIMEKWGATRPQGVLLYGEPGTGKTMLATALAHEIGAELWKIQSSDIYDRWLGASEQNIKQLFDAMKRQQGPTIVLFDEFDALVGISPVPPSGGAGNARNSVAGIFKQEMNDLTKQNPNVLIVATTNHPDIIDQSLIRSGRFDHRIYVPMPDDEARSQIISSLIAKRMLNSENGEFKIFADDVQVAELTQLTDEFSGADIAEIFRRLGMAKAMTEARLGTTTPIGQHEFKQAISEFRREKFSA